jgi:D-glycero-D-manno-heptose 1,7-bisphosphate phosphatase
MGKVNPFKLIILDRDGVINYDSPNYIRSINDWKPIAGSLETIAEWSKSGCLIAIATNQSAISRQYMSLEMLNSIHKKMILAIESLGGKIDLIKFCPHLPEAQCLCRKPKPGLLFGILAELNVSASEACFIGDKATDAGAAKNAKVTFFSVKANTPLELSNLPI